MKNYFKIFTLLFIVYSIPSLAKDGEAIKVITSPVKTNPFTNIYERYQDKSFDFDALLKDSIGGVLKPYVLRYDSINNFHVVVYSDNKYDSYLGYWVGISKDNGHTWQRYYTGLGDSRPYYIKYKSFVPLIKNDSIIEIEVAEVKQTSQEVLPSYPAEFGLTKDNLLLQININSLKQDSDKDGLTDVVEDKLFTNPFSKDTDKDGINDAQDTNPRFKHKKDKYAALYRHLINSNKLIFRGSLIIPFNEVPVVLKKEPKYFTPTYIIITDDIRIQNVSATNHTVIILSNSEWKLYDAKQASAPTRVYVSSLEPEKDKPNQYIVRVSERGSGISFQITEYKKYWVVKIIGVWMA